MNKYEVSMNRVTICFYTMHLMADNESAAEEAARRIIESDDSEGLKSVKEDIYCSGVELEE